MRCWFRSKYTALAAVLLAAAGMKLWLIISGAVPFNADEAVVALMGKHILAGESPVFFYGQAYMGSLDAYIVAVGFAVFGQHIWVIRIIQALLYLGVIACAMALASRIFRTWKAGVAAGLLLAVPSVNTSLYTTVSLGGYGEALLIGSLLLLITLRIADNLLDAAQNQKMSQWKDTRINWIGSFAAWGILAGLGLWVFGLTMVFTVPCFLLLLWWVDKPLLKREQIFISGWITAAGAGFLVGSAPWWAYALRSGISNLVGELSGSAVNVETGSILMRVVNHLISYFLIGLPALLGFRPPWEVRWLILPLIPLILLFWGVIAAWSWRKTIRLAFNPGLVLMLGVLLTQLILFVFTPFGADPSGRYFLPLVIPLAVLTGGWLITRVGKQSTIAWIGLGLVLVFNLAGTIDCIQRNPPGLTTQFNSEAEVDHRFDDDLVSFLRSQGETRGYTTPWLAYPLAFLTGEEIIYQPRLPYHLNLDYTSRDDRYPGYGEAVSASPKTAYITVHHESLDHLIREGLIHLGVTWREEKIGDYRVFYGLSRVVRPEELGIGINTP